MPQLSGTTSGSIRSVAISLPCNIKWFGVRDNGSGSTIRIGIVVSGREIYWKSITLSANASLDELVDVKVLAGSQIILVTNNSVDYAFTLD